MTEKFDNVLSEMLDICNTALRYDPLYLPEVNFGNVRWQRIIRKERWVEDNRWRTELTEYKLRYPLDPIEEIEKEVKEERINNCSADSISATSTYGVALIGLL